MSNWKIVEMPDGGEVGVCMDPDCTCIGVIVYHGGPYTSDEIEQPHATYPETETAIEEQTWFPRKDDGVSNSDWIPWK